MTNLSSPSASLPLKGRIRSFFRHAFQGQAEREAEELLHDHPHSNECLRIDCCIPGEKVTVQGTIRSTTMRPRSSYPVLEIDLYDGTGNVTVIFMGRRRIPGIMAGRFITITGRLTCNTDEPIIYNPKYTLHPTNDSF